jgi:hypothetical protein
MILSSSRTDMAAVVGRRSAGGGGGGGELYGDGVDGARMIELTDQKTAPTKTNPSPQQPPRYPKMDEKYC